MSKNSLVAYFVFRGERKTDKFLIKVVRIVGIGILSLGIGGYAENLKGEEEISPERSVVLSVNRK